MDIDFCDTKEAFQHKADSQLKKERFLFKIFSLPALLSLGTKLISFLNEHHLLPKFILKNAFFYHFCGGESFEEAKKRTQFLDKRKVSRVYFYSIEGGSTLEESQAVYEETLKTFRHPGDPPRYSALKLTGLISTHILEKIQSKVNLTNSEQSAYSNFEDLFAKLCKKAEKTQTHLMIDAEETWVQNVIDKLCLEKMKIHNKTFPAIFTTCQMYRKDKLKDFKHLIELAKSEKFHLGVKLVRGAYLTKEKKRAQKEGRPSPIHTTKEASDKDYDEALRLCFEERDHLSLFSGSHNLDSMKKFSTAYIKLSSKPSFFMTSQLQGMCDFITFKLAQEGIPVSKYIPFGPAEKAVPYLIRRAEENSSILGETTRELYFIDKEIKRRELGR